VAGVQDEHERTIAYAEVALSQIRNLRHAAIPRNYEIWYVYATGHNPELNKTINDTLAQGGRLTDTDLDQIYDNYLAQGRTIDRIGARVANEIDDIMALIAETLGNTASFGDHLQDESQKLSLAADHDQIKAIVQRLVATTREMQRATIALEDRLSTSKQQIARLQDNLEAIRAESLTDPLTGLGNRKYFDRTVSDAVRTATSSRQPLSLLMIDIDHFKSFNDNFGHLTGDQVLRLVGLTLKQSIKGQDFTARYGGEEFAVVLPNTPLQQAISVADNIRRMVMSKELKKKSTGEILGRVTLSAGVSTLKPTDDADALIDRADACLYAAKRNGRNRVICETDPEFMAAAAVA
jgi:diguanylate cyclase